MIKLSALTAALLLVGCAASSPQIIKVDVPIAIVPAPPNIPYPELTVQLLTPTSAYGDIAKAYVRDWTLLTDYSNQCQRVLNQYSDMAKNNPPLPSK